MKRLSMFALVIALILGWSHWGKSQELGATTDLELLQMALTAAEANVWVGELNVWAAASYQVDSLTEIEELLTTIAGALGLNRHQYDLDIYSNGALYWGETKLALPDGGDLSLFARSQGQETCIQVSICQCPPEQMETYSSGLKEVFATIGLASENVKLTTCLEGLLNARLRTSERLDLAYKVFAATEMVYRGAIEAKGIYQWFGWSPGFGTTAETEKGSVNFGISIRWDAVRGQTVIRVATPVLPSSY